MPTTNWALEPCPVEPNATRPMGYCNLCREHIADVRDLSETQLQRLVDQRNGHLCAEAWTSAGHVILSPEKDPTRKRRPLRGRLVPREDLDPPGDPDPSPKPPEHEPPNERPPARKPKQAPE